MKTYDEITKDMLERVLQYENDNPVAPAIPRATALFTQVGALNTAMENHAGTQLFGLGGYRAGATERRILVSDLRTTLLDIAATARGLESVHPGITDQFRLGRQASSHQALLATAQAFLMALEPAAVKQLFTDRAFPADLDVQLTAKITAVAAAVGRKANGRQSQRLGTESLAAINRQVTATMRELRALMVRHLRETNPALLPVWQAAARRYRVPVASTPSTEPPTEPVSGQLVSG
jgi:hypothetical protein